MEFVANLSLGGFEELRKAVIARHQFHAMKIAEIIEYLGSQGALVKSAKINRDACEKTLAEKMEVPLSFATKAVSRFLEVEEINEKILKQGGVNIDTMDEAEDLNADVRNITGQQNTDRLFE